MMLALIQGALSADPVERTTSKGARFATATVRVNAGAESMFIGVAAFDLTAAAKLLALHKGDALAATGALEPNNWVDREGNERHGWRLSATALLTTYEAGRRRKAAAAGRASRSTRESDFPDDSL